MKRKRIAKTFADHEWAIKTWARKVDDMEAKLKSAEYQIETLQIRLKAQSRRTFLPKDTVEYAHQRFDQFNSRIENILKRLHALEHAE